MCADDSTFAMDGSLKYFQKLICIHDDFKLISGLRLNVKQNYHFESRLIEIHKLSTLSKSEVPVDF